jgi:hypothetical protein
MTRLSFSKVTRLTAQDDESLKFMAVKTPNLIRQNSDDIPDTLPCNCRRNVIF